ncbi:heme exporter protein CcmD [Marinihelvus fidelis]|uniref:heme exporter protein CcmD n=1 Tax=Marinihelvus fidelis TaxID=2613842 RepID=UPI001783817D|nr:heme exporter protein CcmD [Marinihelvus fidelis]
MNHTPFILSAYAIAVVVLAWCAIAPVLRGRRFRKSWLAGHRAAPKPDQNGTPD